MFTKKSKKELRDTWAYGLESCHNCDDESDGIEQARAEKVARLHGRLKP